MTGASPLPFPSSRTLAAWWRQLEALRPREWHVGHLFLHRIEAAVSRAELEPLPSFDRLLLRALDFGGHEGIRLGELEKRLSYPAPLLGQALRSLQTRQLLEVTASHSWRLTDLGGKTMEAGSTRHLGAGRSTFCFCESRQADGSRRGPPSFLPLRETPLVRPWRPDPSFSFDPAWLRDCAHRDAAWKEAHGFPAEVLDLLPPFASNGAEVDLPAWRRVVIDRPEEISVVLVRTDDHLLGFPIHPADWRLEMSEPILRLPATTALPLLGEVSAQECRDAWLAWAGPRSLPADDVAACTLRLDGIALWVHAPPRLVEMLRQGKSDVLKKEAWLHLGQGEVRRAARLELA